MSGSLARLRGKMGEEAWEEAVGLSADR
jgi:hypothetical protein